MEKANPIVLLVLTDIRMILASLKPKNPGRFVVSFILFLVMGFFFGSLAYTGGTALALVKDPLFPIRGVFVFAAISSFVLSLLLFVGFNSNTPEIAFLVLTPVKRAHLVIAKLISTTLTIGFFYVVMFILFLFNFSMATKPLYLLTGLVAFVLTLMVSFVLANLCSMLLLRFLKTTSNKRTLKVIGLFVIVAMLAALQVLMTQSVQFLSFTRYVPPAYGADLMLLRMPGMVLLLPYLLIIPAGIYLSVKLSGKLWTFSEPTVTLDKKRSRKSSMSFEEPTFLIAQKELKAMMREPEVILRVLMLFVMLTLWPLLRMVWAGAFNLATISYMLVFLGCTASLVINPNALGTEAKTLWILKTSPLRSYDLFFGKWFLGAISIGVMFFLFIIIYLIVGWLEPLHALMLSILVLEIGLLVPGMTIGIGFNFPDFHRAKKNRPGVTTIAALYVVALLVFLPAIISLSYTFISAESTLDVLFWNALGLGISGLVGGVVTFKLYRKMEMIYEDLESVDGASFLT